MLNGWHVGFTKRELGKELIRRFGWDPRDELTIHVPLTVEKIADILGEMDRLRDLLRNCQAPDGHSCAVCGDNGHQAAECHHIDQVDPGGASGAIGLQRNLPIGMRRALDAIEECVSERIREHGQEQFATMLDALAEIIGGDEVLVLRQAVADKEFEEIQDRFRFLGASSVLMIACLGEISARPGAKHEG